MAERVFVAVPVAMLVNEQPQIIGEAQVEVEVRPGMHWDPETRQGFLLMKDEVRTDG